MKTADLVEALAQSTAPASAARPVARLAMAVLAGGVGALTLMLYGAHWRPVPGIAGEPWFWTKVVYAAALGLPAAWLATGLSRPGGRLGVAALAVPTVLALIAVAGLVQALSLPPPERLLAWRGATWTVCSLRILSLSVPIGLALLAAMRTLAPTRLTGAGAAAGLVAGSVAAALYALHCPEHGLAFIAIWYSLGIAGATACGAWAGRYLLRW